MKKIRFAVVGLNMGRNHCMVFHADERFELVAVCDIDPERIRWVQENVCACKGYEDYGTMLREIKPEAVVVATPTALHYEMVVQAVNAGARGVYCEKPMTVDLETAEKMVALCAEKDVALMVGHQRRVTPVYQEMKRLMKEGAIGKVYLIRAMCAGDFLSDGTHSVDSVRHFMDDQQPRWVMASMFRLPLGTHVWGNNYFTGTRYGHSVESGAQVMIEFENGIRAEILTGELRLPHRGYQDIEIFGDKGRLWRAGDDAQQDILLQDEQAGGFRTINVGRPEAERALDGGGHGANLMERLVVVDGFWRMIEEKALHPMEGRNALKTQEIVMAAYESVRVRNRVFFPLQQKHFALDSLLQHGAMI